LHTAPDVALHQRHVVCRPLAWNSASNVCPEEVVERRLIPHSPSRVFINGWLMQGPVPFASDPSNSCSMALEAASLLFQQHKPGGLLAQGSGGRVPKADRAAGTVDQNERRRREAAADQVQRAGRAGQLLDRTGRRIGHGPVRPWAIRGQAEGIKSTFKPNPTKLPAPIRVAWTQIGAERALNGSSTCGLP